jgi:hypothetical protein
VLDADWELDVGLPGQWAPNSLWILIDDARVSTSTILGQAGSTKGAVLGIVVIVRLPIISNDSADPLLTSAAIEYRLQLSDLLREPRFHQP